MSNRIIKDTIAITVITLVAGLALGVVQDDLFDGFHRYVSPFKIPGHARLITVPGFPGRSR